MILALTIVCRGGTSAADILLPSQSNARGSFVIVDNELAYSWGYLLGYPDKAPRRFRQELYMPMLPSENLGTYQSIPFPQPIGNTDRDWRAVYCNDLNALLLDQEGRAWFVPFATSTNGSPLVTPAQIEFPAGVTSWLTAAVANRQSVFVSTSGHLYVLGPTWTNTVSHLPAAALPWPRFVSCDVRDNQAIALDDQGNLYGWGYNWQGMLGPAETWTVQPSKLHSPPDGQRWEKVALGAEHAVGLSTGGRLFAWGANTRGQLGVTNWFTYEVMECPMPAGVSSWLNAWAGGDYTLALADDGNLYEWGSTDTPPNLSPPPIRKYVAAPDSGGWRMISVAPYHRMALTQNGRLFAWGSNWSGQLGQGRDEFPHGRRRYVPYPYYSSIADPDPVEIRLPTNPETGSAPSARLVTPLHGILIAHTSVVQLAAQVVDPDGQVAEVRFLVDTNQVVTAERTTDGLFAGNWVGVPQGVHLVQVLATDNTGATNTLEDAWLEFLPTVFIAPKFAHAREPNLGTAGTNAMFIVSRTGSTAEPLPVTLSLSYQTTASEGADFHSVGQYNTIEIPAGAQEALVEVPVKPDRIGDPGEVITVYIAYARAVPGDPLYASVVIDDTPDNPARVNQPPQLEVLTPGQLAVYEHGYDVQLYLRYFDADGYVARVEWFAGTNLIAGGGDHPTASVNAWMWWRPPEPGTYQLRVVLQDNEGGTTESEEMQLTVLPPSVKGAGPNSVAVEAIDPIAIRGTADKAMVRVVRSGDAYPHLVASQLFKVDRSPGEDYRMAPDYFALWSGQVAGAFYVRALARDNAPWRQRILFEPADGTAGVPATAARVYLVSTNVPQVGGIAPASPVVLEITRMPGDEVLLEWFTNPGESTRAQFSLDLDRWVSGSEFSLPKGYHSIRLPVVTDLPALFFKAQAR